MPNKIQRFQMLTRTPHKQNRAKIIIEGLFYDKLNINEQRLQLFFRE